MAPQHFMMSFINIFMLFFNVVDMVAWKCNTVVEC